jgi:hypothetical protein
MSHPNPPNSESRTNDALTFIRGRVESGNGFPTAVEIAAHMGWKSDSSGRDLVLRLITRGYVERLRTTPKDKGYPVIRSIYKLTEKGRTEPYARMRVAS